MARTQLYSIGETRKQWTLFGGPQDIIIIHVYDNLENFVTSISVPAEDWFINNSDLDGKTIPTTSTGLHIERILKNNGFHNGLYRIAINFIRPLLINVPTTDISADKSEISLSSNNMGSSIDAFNDIANNPYLIHSKTPSGTYSLPLAVNVNADKFIHVVNLLTQTDPDTNTEILYLKLLEGLPINTSIVNVSLLMSDVSSFYISISTPAPEEPFTLVNPNFDLTYDEVTHKSTGWKTWDDVLGTPGPTSQKLVSDMISGSYGEGMTLNIDYREFGNFIHFSSAEERLKNFHYKMELLETYVTDNATLNALSVTTGVPSANIITNQKKIDGVLNSFDKYENFLYYESGSYYTGSNGGSFHPKTWPKYNNTKPYSNMSSSAPEVSAWYGASFEAQNNYGGQLYSASLYDRDNENLLVKALPQFILEDHNNNQAITYVHMLSQHYDILFNYIKHITSIHSREESPEKGAPKEMLFNIAKSLGINLFNGNNNEDLWSYALGTREDGTTLQTGLGLTSGSLQTISGQDRTNEIWNRLINNLPLLLKSKGTERSVRALVNSYGIPSSILHIMEFGGPEPEGENSQLAINRTANSLRFSGTDNIKHDWAKADRNNPRHAAAFPNTMEMRIKTTTKQNQVLWASNTSKRGLILEHSASGHDTHSTGQSTYGRLKMFISGSDEFHGYGGIISASTAYAPIFDGDWWNIMLRRTEPTGSSAPAEQKLQPEQYDIFAKKSGEHSHGRITHAVSGSTRIVSGTVGQHGWIQANTNNILVGVRPSNWANASYPGAPADIVTNWPSNYGFVGSMQEYRLWTTRLNESAFDQHVQNPQCIVGNNYSSSYYDLITRFTMGTDLLTYDHSINTMMTSSHPQAPRVVDFSSTVGSNYGFASGSGFSTYGNDYEDIEETYYINMPSTIGTRGTSNKIRIEDNDIPHTKPWNKTLSHKIKKEASSFDTSPLDTNKLGIYLSPVHDINIDIANNIGQTRLDDFVGDPRDHYNENYTELSKIRNEYFKKYSGGTGLWDFIRQVEYFDGSLFKIINKFVPRKANEVVGLLFESSILERPKVSHKPIILDEDPFKQTTINTNPYGRPNGTALDSGSGYAGLSGGYITYEGTLSGSRQWEESPHMILAMTSSLESNFKMATDGAPYELARVGTLLKHTLHGYNMSENGSRYHQLQLITHQGTGGYTQGSMSFQLTPVGIRDAHQLCITGSRPSEIYNKKNYFYSSSVSASNHNVYLQMSNPWSGPWTEYRRMAYSSSLMYADYHDDDDGMFKLAFEGSQLSGADINKDTPGTPDGGPVISIFETNPNQLFTAPADTPQFGSILLSGDSRAMKHNKAGTRIPGSQQPGPQGQRNGYWLDTGHQMRWITSGPHGSVYTIK
jgi:hypothetical protein